MKEPHEHPNTTVFDENDENVRYVTYKDAFEHGLIRRLTEVFVVDKENKMILLQRRAKHLRVSPNSWAASVGENVDEGESYEEAAQRGLKEELNLPQYKLILLPKTYLETSVSYTESEVMTKTWSQNFVAIYDGSEISFPEDEISEIKWFSIEEIESLLSEDSSQFAVRFPSVWEKIRDELWECVVGS